MSDDLLNYMWVEKYRPKTLDDVVLPDAQRQYLNQCISDGRVPHLFLVGPQGSGKSTTARIICSTIIRNKMDIYVLNGSSSTSINDVRDTIVPFMQMPPFESNQKIVFIDEFDYMSSNAQAGLRVPMEKLAANGSLICTGNYKSKVINPLLSRFQVFEMKTISEEFALEYCEKILKAEKIEYNVDDVKLVISSVLPDVRKVVGILQQNSIDGKLQNISKDQILSVENKVLGLVCSICDNIETGGKKDVLNKLITEINNTIREKEPDYISLYDRLFQNDEIKPYAKIKISEYMSKHYDVPIPHIHFVAMCWDIIKNGIRFNKMFGGA